MLLKIKNLKLKTILGIYAWEEHVEREIIINLEIESDSNLALTSDNIEDAIDYDKISNKVKNLIATTRFKLIEKMAQEVMNKIMQDQRIIRCKIEIDKVGALDFVESASITIEQFRKNGS
jgi:FolB domain-containing protein